MKRIIPATMASQHPDHAAKPYWHTKEFISTRQEIKECFLAFSELGIQEYKWDLEGKFVDESIIEKMFLEHVEYFATQQLGIDKFLTFRLPNPKVETEFRLGRAFMGIMAASGLAKQLGLHPKPLFEVILPMTETAEEILNIQEAYEELGSLKHNLFNMTSDTLRHIEVIPLFEQVETIWNSHTILTDYLALYKKRYGKQPAYLRPYIARSDPALNSGLVPTVLAVKVALSRYAQMSQKTGIPLYPILGSASLPFRGGLTPYTIKQFTEEYKGIRTALIQSAFRYDYPLQDVKEGIRQLNNLLIHTSAPVISKDDEKKLNIISHDFEKQYKPTIEALAPIINHVAVHIPARRERVQHVGLFGYSRGMGKVHLPRAITFTGSLYALGAPPEIIGTGRALKKMMISDDIGIIDRIYPGLRSDLTRAGRFVSKDTVKVLAQQESVVWNDVLEDIQGVEAYLGSELGPVTQEEKEHASISSFLVMDLEHIHTYEEQLNNQALLRKSIG